MILKLLSSLFLLASFTQAASAHEMNLDTAKQLLQAAENYGKAKGWALSIAVVNSEGNLVAFQRGDGSYSGSVDSAIQKAKSANAFQRPTSAFVKAVQDGRFGILSAPEIVAIEGGVPAVVSGQHIGAIGVSGAKAIEDEEVASSAVRSLK